MSHTSHELNDYLANLCEGSRLQLVPPTSSLLRTPAHAVTNIAGEVLPWVGFIRDLIFEKNAVAIAAQQVGVPLAFFVSRIKGIPLAVNPRVVSRSGGRVSKQEGSLSWPGRLTYIARAPSIVAEWTAKDGKVYTATLRDFDARVFQHMCDQLAGVCIFT